MQTPSEEAAVPHAPLYYRWRDERSLLIVEIKIELVPRMLADLQAAEEMGMEGGGLLVGCFPKTAGPPLLRIEEFETVGRRGGDGLPYILLAEQRQRFTTVRKKAATRELSALGYFRSHLRTGAFELSVGDRDLMAAEFRNSIHVALLIAKDQSGAANAEKARHLATYFVSVNGIIQNRVDPMTFPFEEEDLLQLAIAQPKPPAESRPVRAPRQAPAGMEPDAAAPASVPQVVREEPWVPRPRARTGGGLRGFAWVSVGLLAVLTLLFVVWGWQGQGSSSPTRLELSVVTQESGTLGNQSLHVTWNRGSLLLANATKAVLTISDRASHQTIEEFELAPSDLKAGNVKVEMAGRPVEISLVLWMADATRVTQVAEPRS